jgi:two-component system response regulator NreC
MAKVRVLLADDHTVIREGLRALLDAQVDVEVVGEVADGLDACARAKELAPDVVIMDISMPGLNGARATEAIRRECPGTQVLVLTAHEDKGYLRLLVRAGASGYLLKRAASQDLIHAIRTVAAGGTYLDPTLAGEVLGSFAHRPPSKGSQREDELSDREAEVVRLIARGFSNKEIAVQLNLSSKTVETYKARSLEKLGLSSRSDLVSYALQRGWLEV